MFCALPILFFIDIWGQVLQYNILERKRNSLIINNLILNSFKQAVEHLLKTPPTELLDRKQQE